MDQEDLKRGYVYVVAPTGNVRNGWFPVLCLGVHDFAARYALLEGEAEGSDPQTWMSQWIQSGELRPEPNFISGSDGPFEVGSLVDGTAPGRCWVGLWSECRGRDAPDDSE